LVVKLGLDQLSAAYLVMVATLGITFTLQATYSETRSTDLACAPFSTPRRFSSYSHSNDMASFPF